MGGTSSELFLLYALTTVFFGAAYPPRPQVGLLAFTFACYVVALAISGGQLVIGGTNNVGAGGTYSVLATTNLLVALTNWTVLANGTFDASGNFLSTNATGTNSQRFFILRVP